MQITHSLVFAAALVACGFVSDAQAQNAGAVELPSAAGVRFTPRNLPPFALSLLGPGAPQTGQVVITEFMKDPAFVADTRGEWIEVYNNLPWRVNLEGWTLSDDAGALHVINVGGAGLRLRPGQYAILGNNNDPTQNGGVTVDYVWGSFSLSNGADSMLLTRPDGVLVDRVAYDDGVAWPDTGGRSISLKLSARNAQDNDNAANWCHSSTPISATNTDTGTPRLDNDACP